MQITKVKHPSHKGQKGQNSTLKLALKPISRSYQNKFSLYQQGISLIEVMISIFILGIAALGFSLLQARALNATSEAMQYTQALNVLQNLSSQMRLNLTIYGSQNLTSSSKELNDTTIIKFYKDAMDLKQAPISCSAQLNGVAVAPCNQEALAKSDVWNARALANSFGIEVGLRACPETVKPLERQCLIAAWGETKPEMSGDATACLNDSGAYNNSSTCLLLEVD